MFKSRSTTLLLTNERMLFPDISDLVSSVNKTLYHWALVQFWCLFIQANCFPTFPLRRNGFYSSYSANQLKFMSVRVRFNSAVNRHRGYWRLRKQFSFKTRKSVSCYVISTVTSATPNLKRTIYFKTLQLCKQLRNNATIPDVVISPWKVTWVKATISLHLPHIYSDFERYIDHFAGIQNDLPRISSSSYTTSKISTAHNLNA